MNETFVKHDNGKLRWSLLPIEPIEEVIKVLMHGSAKYSDNNWQKCEDLNRYYDACLRHLTAWKLGRRIDEESSLSHLSHALCCLIFLSYLDDKKEKDGCDLKMEDVERAIKEAEDRCDKEKAIFKAEGCLKIGEGGPYKGPRPRNWRKKK